MRKLTCVLLSGILLIWIAGGCSCGGQSTTKPEAPDKPDYASESTALPGSERNKNLAAYTGDLWFLEGNARAQPGDRVVYADNIGGQERRVKIEVLSKENGILRIRKTGRSGDGTSQSDEYDEKIDALPPIREGVSYYEEEIQLVDGTKLKCVKEYRPKDRSYTETWYSKEVGYGGLVRLEVNGQRRRELLEWGKNE